MNWLRLMLSLALLLLVVGGGAYVVFNQKAGPEDDKVILNLQGASFPTEDGTQVTLDDIHARIRIVNFWASWSPSSAEELTSLTKLQEGYGNEIKVIAINRDATKEDGFEFLKNHNLNRSLVYLYDSTDSYYKELGGYNMPETVFIGARDEVLAHIHGPMTYDDMQSVLRALLAQE